MNEINGLIPEHIYIELKERAIKSFVKNFGYTRPYAEKHIKGIWLNEIDFFMFYIEKNQEDL